MNTHTSTGIRRDSAAVMNALLESGSASRLTDLGQGQIILNLHGGGGVATIAGISDTLAERTRVLTPTHPGFDGTPRPDYLGNVSNLAQFYLTLLATLDIDNVIIIGSSLGGWIAAEMASIATDRIKGLVLLNAVGIEVPGETVLDVSQLPRAELIKLANHNPEIVLKNMPPMTSERLAILALNAATLSAYDNGAKMMSPGLRERLVHVQSPALVLWGESDGIASINYGRAYANAFGRGEFRLIEQAGHLPQLEQPANVVDHIKRFITHLDSKAAVTTSFI